MPPDSDKGSRDGFQGQLEKKEASNFFSFSSVPPWIWNLSHTIANYLKSKKCRSPEKGGDRLGQEGWVASRSIYILLGWFLEPLN